jgi:subtilisin family serine protease
MVMKHSFWIATVFSVFFAAKAAGQKKYWIFFSDKDRPAAATGISPETQKARNAMGLEEFSWTDWPLKTNYLSTILRNKISIVCKSKWLNAVSAVLDNRQLEVVKQLPFVKGVREINTGLEAAGLGHQPAGDNPWKWAFDEINAAVIVNQKLTGKDVKIGIIDGGFRGADKNKYLEELIQQGSIKAMRDFVDPTVTSLFNPKRAGVDDHGMYVLQMLGGCNKKDNIQYGMATGASYYLARADDAVRESRQEEDYWISALEWMDSLGVRLVNSSLGYSHYFDNAGENYKITDMNGSTSLVAKAAQLAVDKKGMIIVSSIGNEGRDSAWQVLTTPSDAAGVISVGAADIDYWFKPGFSSIGPPFLQYLKPNIACPTADGTSFSAPFITGLIACMLERKPDLTNEQVKDIIEKSGHLYPYGNNFIGYGLPDAQRVLKLLEDPGFNFNRTTEILAAGDSLVLYLDTYRGKPGEVLTFFFKKDKYTVHLQAISEDNRFVLRRRKNIPRITIASRSKVLEVIWQ